MQHHHTEHQSLAEQLEDFARRSGLTETYEEHYGHEGDISHMLDRRAAQRRLDEVVRPVPQTD